MTAFQGGLVLADLALIMVVARLMGLLARKVGQPAVIGEIVAGILLGPTLFHGVISRSLLPVGIRPFLTALADLGLVLFMFMVGLEFDFRRLRGSGRVAGGTAAGSTLLPFGLGLLLALYLERAYHPARPVPFALFVGVAVSVSAFPVLARILTDRKMHRTRLGTVALSAAAACDLAAWTALALVQAIDGTSGEPHWLVLLGIPYAAVLIMCVRPLLARLLARSGSSGALSGGSIALVLAGLLASAAVSQLIGLQFVFGAFLFGLALPRLDSLGFRAELLYRAEPAAMVLLPVYFVIAGLNVDLSRIGDTGVAQLGIIVAVAVAGKFGGTWAGARAQGLPTREAAVLGTLMNTRGLTELVALSVGLQIGVLDTKLYSIMVAMAVSTTAMTGPLLRLLTGQGEAAAAGGEREECPAGRAEPGPGGGEAGRVASGSRD
jgi:Kef-type K+ transport system membrane component KefB